MNRSYEFSFYFTTVFQHTEIICRNMTINGTDTWEGTCGWCPSEALRPLISQMNYHITVNDDTYATQHTAL
jgi:hypothetical protein